MNGAAGGRSQELLQDLVRQARAAEDDAWARAARAREREAVNELADALRVIETATAARVRLEEELRRAVTGRP